MWHSQGGVGDVISASVCCSLFAPGGGWEVAFAKEEEEEEEEEEAPGGDRQRGKQNLKP